MEPGAQVSEWSSPEDEDSPPEPRSWGAVPKHSTPSGAFLHRSRGRLSPVPYRPGGGPADGSPLPARAPRGLPSPVLRKRRLSTIWASDESSAQLEPDTDPRAPEQEPPEPAETTGQLRHQRQRRARQGVSPGSWPGAQGLPGISDATRRSCGKLRKLTAAVRERVRQWEARQLQSIEEATHHDLAVQDE